MQKRTVGLCLGMVAVTGLLWAADFNPDGTINVGQTFRPATGGEEISCLPEFNPNDPYYLEIVEKLHKAREQGNRELVNSITSKIQEFTGQKSTQTRYENMDRNIVILKPSSEEVLTREELSELAGKSKGYEWENVEIYNANQSGACYGDIGSASNSGGSGDTLYAVFDRWYDDPGVWGIQTYRSTDGGDSWSMWGGFYYSVAGRDYRYPTLAVSKSDTLLIAYYVDNASGNDWVRVCKYKDWTYDFQMASDASLNVCCPDYASRPRIVVDYPYLSDYFIYVAYQIEQGGSYYLRLARSTTQNISYTQTTLKLTDSPYQGWDLMYVYNYQGSGTYLLHARPYGTEVKFMRSIDDGTSWSGTGLAPISTGSDVYFPTIGGVNQTDNLFCAWQSHIGANWAVYGRYSNDRAESWSSDNISVLCPGAGNVNVPVIQERTFDDTYCITAFHRPDGSSCQVLVGHADILNPDVWEYDMARDTSAYQSWPAAPRIVTHSYGGGYNPVIVWTDQRDGDYDWYFGKRLPAKDIASTEIYWPFWCKVSPETTATPSARIKNVGEVDVANAPVVFEITDRQNPADSWIDTTIISSLPAGDSVDVNFDNWTSGIHPTSYEAKVYTLLDGDIDPGNDTLVTYFSACNRQLESGWGTPTLDGILDTVSEWGDAGKIDISETMGWDGNLNTPRSCILYTLNNSDTLYLGVDYKADNSLEEGDGLIFYFDEDHDGVWNPDSSEGDYRFWYPDSSVYSSFTSPAWRVVDPPGFEVAPALIGGRVTYEVKIPLGTEKTDLTTIPGDVMGFFCLAYDKSVPDYGGWYPQDWYPWFSPEYMTDLKLAEGVGIEESQEQLPEFALKILGSNPIGSKVLISFSIPERAKVKLSVYDLSGRLVNRLADGVFAHGIHKVAWKPVLSNGVYFIRLEGGGREVTKKVVLLR
ncbi:hypothetical protein CH333_01710 [candidate division WOR-3 bacterium JGI_Cruoil_03_44_89]|uniref:Secretion system C-terminal sorting domain-containing protein n=1 Tax=candidate division WOR-3 bacterium JGI_Cruoil_03_44_89 TaxID=1973748 RepID=A0A235C036_UNCW3|nr:MAG: hypothetical protein CH333_01710 [candidate division WOR-3 bacterium JGI_Cruoil_03_44_89]